MSSEPIDRLVPAFELRHRMHLALERAGVSVQEMADELEVSRNTIGNYLAGRTSPPTAVLKVWAARCNVHYFWLRTGVPESPTSDEAFTKRCRVLARTG